MITDPRRRGRFAGLSPDDRRAERRRLLLDAAFDLQATEGSASTTVRAVCQAAGLNPRYFYESFEDRDALFVAVYDRLVAQLRDDLVAALAAAPEDLPSQMRTAVEVTVAFIDDDRRRARVLYVESLSVEAVSRRRVPAGHELAAFVQQDARRRRGTGPDEGDPTSAIVTAVLIGGMSAVLMSWIDGRIDIGRDELIEDLTALFVAMCDRAAARSGERGRALGTVPHP